MVCDPWVMEAATGTGRKQSAAIRSNFPEQRAAVHQAERSNHDQPEAVSQSLSENNNRILRYRCRRLHCFGAARTSERDILSVAGESRIR
jgi:hypothetical protein